MHALVPDAEETLKWGAPTYLKDGKILLITASFKAHAAVNFWRGKELGLADDQAMGQLGKLASVDDLPANFDELVTSAAALSQTEAPKKPKAAPKPALPLHPEFEAALASNTAARASFTAFSPSHRREYCEWINEAKRDETRTKRIATTIEWLSEGKKRNWKYENC